jgi:hypothetical protein
MKIRMLKTENGSVDGIRVKAYEQGVEYDLTNTQGERELAAAFVAAGMAEEVEDTPTAPLLEQKAGPIAEENKAEPLAPENKDEQPAESKRGRRKS